MLWHFKISETYNSQEKTNSSLESVYEDPLDEGFSTKTPEPGQGFDPTEMGRDELDTLDELDTHDDQDVSGSDVIEVSLKPDDIYDVTQSTDYEGQNEDEKVETTKTIDNEVVKKLQVKETEVMFCCLVILTLRGHFEHCALSH